MKRLFLMGCWLVALAISDAPALAQPSPAPSTSNQPAAASPIPADDQANANRNAATAAAVATNRIVARPPAFLEHIVDSILDLFQVGTKGNTVTHFAVFAFLLAASFLLRRVVTGIVFSRLKKFAARTQGTLDDKLYPALEGPVATFILVTGIFAACKVLKLSEPVEDALDTGATVAFSLVIFWGLLRAFNAVLDHAQEIAVRKNLGIATLMPWIKKTLVAVFVVIGTLLVIRSLGFEKNVQTLLAGLGIGGLAFALAAQDTIANLFGSIVVAIDQPFKVGEAIKIGASEGVVEDIGLRSTRLRTPGKNLIVLPNKMVAAEAIVNNSRFTARRVEQVISITYDATADQVDALVNEMRQLILAEVEVAPTSVMVYFRDFAASSLDIWMVYETKSPDFQKQMALRQRVNLAIMRLVDARGHTFAFPTQTMHLDGPVAKLLAGQKSPPNPPPTG